jgi:hypothetical protein
MCSASVKRKIEKEREGQKLLQYERQSVVIFLLLVFPQSDLLLPAICKEKAQQLTGNEKRIIESSC